MITTVPVRFLGESKVGQWTILSMGDGYHCEVISTPQRTEVEKGPILWVHAYLRSESAWHAPMEKAMLRPGVEPEPEGKCR